jgi:hypothetical protein
MGSRVFTAQFSSGECATCGERINAGEEVRFDNDDELVHFSCERAPTTPCPKCFLVHAGDCNW